MVNLHNLFSEYFSYVIDPQVHLFFFLVFLLYQLRKAKLWKKAVGVCGALYFVIVFYSPVTHWLGHALENRYTVPARMTHLDTAVVLGGGSLSYMKDINQYHWNSTIARFMEGVRLYQEGWVKSLIVTGFDLGAGPHTEGEISSYKRLAGELGLPATKLIIDDRSFNTRDHPINVKRIFAERGISSFYLVTSAIHMTRAMAVFRKQGLDPVAYPVEIPALGEDTYYPLHYLMNSHLEDWRAELHEYWGLFTYRVFGYL